MATLTVPLLGNRDVDFLLTVFGFGARHRRLLESKGILPRGCSIRARGASATLYTSLVLQIIPGVYLREKLGVEVDLERLARKAQEIHSLPLFNAACREVQQALADLGGFSQTAWAGLSRQRSPLLRSKAIQSLTRLTEKQHIAADRVTDYLSIDRGYIDRIEDGHAVAIFHTPTGYTSEDLDLRRVSDIESDYEGAPIERWSTQFGSVKQEFLIPGLEPISPSDQKKLDELDQAMRRGSSEQHKHGA
ncbi:MAG TPA: hypothetical protein VJ123_06280 [Anaerolineales bacterium]|nr:hypothetical protein [Anaerolineales bacterium]